MKKQAYSYRLLLSIGSLTMFALMLAVLLRGQANIAAQEIGEEVTVKTDANIETDQTSTLPPNLIQPKGATGPEIYMVILKDAPLASYRGGIDGLAATNPAARGETKVDPTSADSVAYLEYLAQQRQAVISQANAAIGRNLNIIFEYMASLNGFAAEMTPEEAAQIAVLPNVFVVERQKMHILDTDAGPAWIGAPGIWDGSQTGGLPGTMGEGVVVGVIDTGVDPWNPSFAATGDDGYTHTNPLGSGNYLGVCDPTNVGGGGVVAYDPTFPCNDKLIGVWGYTASDPNPRDSNGHGSHTSSTAAGNFVYGATITTSTAVFTADISGVAPHANLIVYDGCIDGGGCPGASLQAARDQAILDGVDVINYSIGSSTPTSNPWTDTEALSWLAVRDAGIFVADSAGNSGPGSATVGSPPDIPWMTSVGASSHNRTFLNSATVTDGTNTLTVNGESMTGPLSTPAEVVYAADFVISPATPDEARLCAPGAFPAGTFTGEIVICERGVYGRVAKGQSVLDGGAGGMILAQPAEFGGGPGALAPDPHVLPAVHIDYYEYQALNAFMSAATGSVMGTIAGSTLDVDDAHGDIMASFSSRGPNRAVPDIIVPAVTAPGRGIWAAYHQGSSDGEFTFNVIQGTSMSSPHVAGTGALLRALHPDWTVGEIQSALMTTADITVLNDDGINPATPFAMGAGRVNVADASRAGIVLDVTTQEFLDADPSIGGDPKTLNLSSLGNAGCFGECSWTRTVSSTLPYTVTWVSSVEVPAGMTIDVQPATFELAPYATQTITVTTNVLGAPTDEWSFGRVWLSVAAPELTLSKDDGGVSVYPEDDIVYTLSYANIGETGATGVVITETVPTGTTFNAAASTAGWADQGGGVYTLAIGDVASSASDDAMFAVTVDASTPPGTITNTAQISGDNLSVGSATDTTTILAVPPETDSYIYLPIIMRAGAAAAAQTVKAVQGVTAVPIDQVPDAHLTVGAYSVSCGSPDLISMVVSTTSGSEDHLICPATVEVTDLTVDQYGLTEGTVYTDSLSVDPTNGDPYDNLNDGTVSFITVTVPADAARLVAEVTESEAPDIDLYVGTGDTPSAATEQCFSASASNIEYCNIDDPAAGVWWILIQNWAESATPPDDVTLVYAVVPGADAGDWTVSGPPTVASGDPLTATISWNEPNFSIGDRWYGDFELGVSPPFAGQLAQVNVNFIVEGIPVIDTDATSYGATLASGDAVTFTATITNIGTATLDWTIDEDNDALAHGPTVILYDNGPLVNCPGCGAGGADESQLQTGLGMTILGFGHSLAAGLRVSDQFTVTDAAGWTIDQFTFYAYQTGSTTTSTIDHVNYRIWDGPPNDAGSNIVYGDTTTNRLASTAWSNIYRVSVTGNTQRPVMANVASGGFYLPQGTYWVDWQTGGTLASGPWAPPITINGQTVTGDALQYNAGWVALLDGTSPQGLPFIIEGSVGGASLPCDLVEDIPWASVSPNSGSNAPGVATDVSITFDATGLSADSYSGNLCINSNDPVTPEIIVPVSLDVTGSPPVIVVDPTLVASTQPTDTTAVQTLVISNTGGADLDWTIDEAASSAPSAAPFEAVAVNPGLLLSAPARTTPARLADSPYVVLYDQTDNVGVNGFPSQNFETVNNAYDNAGADDFIIPAGDGSWTIESVDVIGVYSAGGGPTPSVDVNIYADNAGLPGTLVYSAPGVVPASDVGGDLGITLLAPAVLPSGHYWVSVIANMNFTPNGQWFWNTRTVQANNPYAWQNPGNGFGTGCVTWSPGAGTCGVGGGVEPDALFRLNGTIGGGGGGGCSAPSDIPWVSVSPASGTTTPGGGVPVDVTFDSTGLSIGVYTGTLCINSNDPVTPLVEVPVELTVTSGSGGGTVTQVFTNTTPVAIPTGPGVVTSTIVVAGANSYLYDLNMTTFIQHTFAADMDITIMSPAGTVVTLSSDNGTGNDNVFNGTVWDDSANPAGQVPYTTNNGLVTDHVYVNLTLASPLVPEETFGAFIGENPNGTWVITISDDLAGDGGSLDSWSLEITSGAAPSTSSQSFSNITPTPIPTGPAVASAVITVTGMTGSILDLNLTTFIQHTFAADMDITLMSPAGTVVTLSSDNGTSNDNVFNGTVWDDSADPDGQVPYTTNNGMVTDNAYVNLTLASPLTPEESMAAFNGEDPNGVWTITISDDLAGDGGSLDSWTLDITTAQ